MKKLLFVLCLATIAVNDLFAGKAEDIALLRAVDRLEIEKVEKALAQNANVNAIMYHASPLMRAVVQAKAATMRGLSEEDALAIIKLLISKGADVNLKNKAGETALLIAIQEGVPNSVIQALKDAGAR